MTERKTNALGGYWEVQHRTPTVDELADLLVLHDMPRENATKGAAMALNINTGGYYNGAGCLVTYEKLPALTCVDRGMPDAILPSKISMVFTIVQNSTLCIYINLLATGKETASGKVWQKPLWRRLNLCYDQSANDSHSLLWCDLVRQQLTNNEEA